MDPNPLIALTTDFGTADGYVGAMKGAILSLTPGAQLIDVTHDIKPQDVHQASYVVYTVYPYFPNHTIHLVVVDPGVGSARRAIALRTPAGTFVGPDNGLFSLVMASQSVETIVALTNPQYHLPPVSHTFHGRDLFAPVAAHLAAGAPIAELGPPVTDPITFPPPRLEVTPGHIAGEIVHIDAFGNAITSIARLDWSGGELLLSPSFGPAGAKDPITFAPQRAGVEAGEWQTTGVSHTYADVQPGQAITLVGSSGHLEIAIRQGNAARQLGLRRGDEVIVRF